MTAQEYHDIIKEKLLAFKIEYYTSPTHIYMGKAIYNIIMDNIDKKLPDGEVWNITARTYIGMEIVVVCPAYHIGLGIGYEV